MSIENTSQAVMETVNDPALDAEKALTMSQVMVAGAGLLSIAGTFGATIERNLDSDGTVPAAVSQLVREGIDTLSGNDSLQTDIDFDVDFPGKFGFPDFALKTTQTETVKNDDLIKAGSETEGETPPVQEYIPGEVEITREPVPDTVETRVDRQTEAEVIAMEWARAFSEDPQADKLSTPGQIDAVVERINALEASGRTITEIKTIGHASDEDDTANTNPELGPGLGIPSQKNVELGTLRGEVVQSLLQPKLEEYTATTGGHLPDVVNEIGVEVQDPLEQLAVEAYAAENNLDGADISNLMKAYNRGEYVPDDLRPLFDAIAEDRFVLVEVTSIKTEQIRTSNPDKITVSVGEGRYESVGGTEEQIDEGDEHQGDGQHEKSENGEIDLTLMLIVLPSGLAFVDMKRRHAQASPNGTPVRIQGPPEKPAIPRKRGQILPRSQRTSKVPEVATPLRPEGKKDDDSGQSSQPLPVDKRALVKRTKQPRPHNFHGGRNMKGQGKGRLPRAKGGNASHWQAHRE